MAGTQPRINISHDRLTAELILASECAVDVNTLRQLVSRAGLRHGLIATAIAEAATSDNSEERRYTLARGTAPRDPQEAGPHFSVADGDKIIAGEEIGDFAEHDPGSPGMGVDGRSVPQKDRPRSPLIAGYGVQRQDKKLIAAEEGTFYVVGGIALIAPDGISPKRLSADEIIIKISDNNLAAHLHIPGQCFAAPVDLAAAVHRSGIQYGLDRDMLGEAARPKKKDRELLLAMGAAPEAGRDEIIENLITPPAAFTYDDEEGQVDFRAAQKSAEVKAGTVLARWTKAGPGTDGLTVLGRTLSSRPGTGKGIAHYRGDGVTIGVDGVTLVAKRDGVLNIDKHQQLRVDNIVLVNGDIDNECGSIDTEYPVHVHGDIKAGFSVRCGGFLEVDGVIEDASITVGGDLTVRRGILPGNRSINVGGDIAALYCRGRKINARNIAIVKDLRHSEVSGSEHIFAAQIIGGEVRTAKTIKINIAGNEEEEPTRLEAGFDPELRTALGATKQCLRLLENQVAELQQEAQDAKSHASELSKRLEMQKRSGAKADYLRGIAKEAKSSVEVAKRAQAVIQELQQDVEAFELQRDDLIEKRDRLRNSAVIKVDHQVFPRVTFSVGGAGSDVSLNEQPGGAWRVVDGSVIRERA